MFFYKKFCILFVFGTIISAAGWVGLVYFQLGVPTESTRWIYELVSKKNYYASKIDTPKIIIASGSNSLFGVSARKIENELKIPAINTAVHAGLELEYILHQVKGIAKSGDIIILPLEYEHYNYDSPSRSPYSETIIDYLISRDTKYFKQKSYIDKAQIIFGMNNERWLKGIKAKFLPDKQSDSGYQSDTVDEYGDETANIGEKEIKNITHLGPTNILLAGIHPKTKSWMHLSDFVLWCRENNISLVAAYPSILYNDVYFLPKAAETAMQIHEFWTLNNIPVLGRYDEFVYERKFFYDTFYHLNDVGREQHTRRLIFHLKDLLNRN
jgi:hypothetical protein